MTTADVRDMLDLPSSGRPRPAKKQKTVEKRPEGITRELYALLGERAPPVAITDHVRYKERPKRSHKVHPWEMRSFLNPARHDDLVLRHWRRKPDTSVPGSTSHEGDEETKDIKRSEVDTEYYYAKFDVKVPVPEYSDSEYSSYLQDDDWTKDETDYLMKLCLDHDLRWIVISDRYDYSPAQSQDSQERSTALTTASKPRSMEDLKARYYTVAAKLMSIRQPLSSMSTAEFELHEKMSKFDAAQESQRKRMAEGLLSRTREEIKEEEYLLSELKRIVQNQDRMMEERKELYARLEAPHSTSDIQAYQSSQGLSGLMQSLLTADKSKKRRSLPGGPVENGPTSATGTSNANLPSGGPKESKEPTGRDSLSGPSNTKKPPPNPPSTSRKLTAREEEMYGVTHHDRLSSGVSFRHERITRLLQAKSNIQAQRVSRALAELEIPQHLVMPTRRVCEEFERLLQGIMALVEVRKVEEKVEGEIKVLDALRAEREGGGAAADAEKKEEEEEGGPNDGAEPAAISAGETGGGDDDRTVAGGNDDDDDGAADADPTDPPMKQETNDTDDPTRTPTPTAQPPPSDPNPAAAGPATTRSQGPSTRTKRSASVLSAASAASSKRQRK
ncbi:MAG: swr complex subunit [Caeruleum heppii]|nr:MAG: swr complex subunit [Caeruleum heppii]